MKQLDLAVLFRDYETDLSESDHVSAAQRLVETPLLATIFCVVHRFLGHCIPEHRVTLYAKCTDALLYGWDRSKFGHAALLGELDALAKRKLGSGLARKMHDGNQAEVPKWRCWDISNTHYPISAKRPVVPRRLSRKFGTAAVYWLNAVLDSLHSRTWCSRNT